MPALDIIPAGAAMRAGIHGRFGAFLICFFFFPLDVCPLNPLIFTAMRARHQKIAHIRLLERRVYFAHAGNGRRGAFDDFAVPKRGCSFYGQLDRIALFAGRQRVAVDFVHHDDTDRAAGQLGGRIGADHGDVSAGERFVQDGIAAVLAVRHLSLQARRIAEHRHQAVG